MIEQSMLNAGPHHFLIQCIVPKRVNSPTHRGVLDHLSGGGLPPPHPPPPLNPSNSALKVAKHLKSHYSHFVHLKAYCSEILPSVI